MFSEKLTRPSTQWLLLALAVGLALAVALSMVLADDAEAKKKKRKPNTPPAAPVCQSSGMTTVCLAKTAPQKSSLNKPLTFTITPSVPTGEPVGGLFITDTLPPGVTFVSATTTQGTCSQSAGTVNCGTFTLGPIGPGFSGPTTGTIQIVVIPNSKGAITNTASDNFSQPNTATATVRVVKKKKQNRHH